MKKTERAPREVDKFRDLARLCDLAGAGFTIAGTFGGVAVSQAATIANGTYASAGSYQTALQTAIDNALTTDGAAAGSLKATVSDVGGGVWKVELNSASVGSGNIFVISATAGNVGVANGTSSNQANSLSQTFQIGANNGESLAVSFNGISASILGTLLAMIFLYFVSTEQGAVSLFDGMLVHEFVHDGRHLLGFPCH